MASLNQIVASTLATATEVKPATRALHEAAGLEDLLPAFTDYATSLETVVEENSTKATAFDNLVAARKAAIAAGFDAAALPLPAAPEISSEAALGPLRSIRTVNNELIKRTEKIIESNTCMYNNLRLRQDEIDAEIRKIESAVEARAAAEALASLPTPAKQPSLPTPAKQPSLPTPAQQPPAQQKEKESISCFIVVGSRNTPAEEKPVGMVPVGAYTIYANGKNLERKTDRETVRYNFVWKAADGSTTGTSTGGVTERNGIYCGFADVNTTVDGPDHACFTWVSRSGTTNIVTRRTAAGSFLEFISGTHIVTCKDGVTRVFDLVSVDVEY